MAELHARAIEASCRLIETAATPPPLATLAETSGFSPHYFHRVFRKVTGLTPRAYAAARPTDLARGELRDASSMTDAIYGAGFSGPGRFYAGSGGMLGMKPSSCRDGGSGESIMFAVGETSLGSILVASTARGVCAILMGDDPDALARNLQDRFPHAEIVGGDDGFEDTVAAVVGLVERPGSGFDLPLDIRGTAFQDRVWQALREVPAGSMVSYADVARRIGAPGSSRAVAQACGANALALAIPCHRVVRTDGSISGYRWGVERKRELLNRESKAA